MASLRTLLVLGRVSNLPTVWTNCLAGWLLGGGGEWSRFAWLCAGATLVYVGGMFLNDAFDAEFDTQHRRERPIPSGAISRESVWLWSALLLAAGTGMLGWLGREPAILALQLLVCVVLYDAYHKSLDWSPVLMASCRFFLVLTAAAAGVRGVGGLAIWTAVVLGCYIVGLSYLARRESAPGLIRYWPLVFLAAPLVLAFIVNDGFFREKALLASAIVALWALRCLRPAFWQSPPEIGKTVSGLLAGICLVDLLSVADQPPQVSVAFLACFVLALVFQRFVPAT
ncbi:MAG: UbiA prenyltransferase [Limisphaerales bacterium]|nr:MAG: UbiA prenyltransferase [Limisphaerales bacterium]KAG0507379.1 MAG: UbiA prenyltransferase [Limisphaerales bacterium]TXT50737.1 MAG: UbiA prenyltransferase [Limisphaerales bacterium]